MDFESLKTLSREEYLPLARRTMDQGMTKRERLALESLRGKVSRETFSGYLVPLRAAEPPRGVTLFAGDEFRAAWVNDRHRDLIEAALSRPLVEISARRLP